MKEKMGFKEFEKEVVERIKDYLPEEYASAEVSLENVRKNNDLQLTGLIIKNENGNICPCIYLEEFYKNYVNGDTVDEVFSKIAECRVQYEPKKSFDVEKLTNFEQVKDKILPRLVNAEMNKERLLERPHKFLLDLAITYCVAIDAFEGNASVAVTNSLMEIWGKSVEELHEVAINNYKTLTPSTFKSMADVLSKMMGISVDVDKVPMYVLTNSIGANGAAALLDTDKLNEIEKELGEFMILPSSVHEVIILPKKVASTVEELEYMIQEVNDTEVQVEDRLGEHVYTYSSKNGLVMMPTTHNLQLMS